METNKLPPKKIDDLLPINQTHHEITKQIVTITYDLFRTKHLIQSYNLIRQEEQTIFHNLQAKTQPQTHPIYAIISIV